MLGNNKKKQPKRLGSQLLRKFRQQGNNRGVPEMGMGDNEEQDSVVLTIYHRHQKKEIAQVILNGYHIGQEVTLGSLGAMRSFKIVRGDLWEQWNRQTAVALTSDDGQEVMVRIAALPVDDDSFGLIEFVGYD